MLISETTLRSLARPPKGNKVYYDEQIVGYGVRITASGATAFVMNYSVNGRERRITIGRHPAWSANAARAEAKELRRQIDKGEDPLSARQQERSAPTLGDLFNEYCSKHLPSKAPRSQKEDLAIWNSHILPILGRYTKVSDISHIDVDRLHSVIAAKAPIRANRVVEVLSKAMSLSIRWSWREKNPCTGTRLSHEEPRHRYLTTSELSNLNQSLEAEKNKKIADAILFLLLTGARRGEVLQATWECFDLDQGVWTKPSAHTKNRRIHRIPLSTSAVEILMARKGKSSGRYVFPGETPDKPLTDINHCWRRIRARAGLDDLHLHDLRHTFASILASANVSLPVMGALLGHTQPQTTMRYAHLFDKVLRNAVSEVATHYETASK